MNILIIGSNGFIGSTIKKYLSYEYSVFSVDITGNGDNFFLVDVQTPNYDEIFKLHQFDCCINASGFANVSLSLKEPFMDFNANTKNVFLMLDAIRKFQPKCKFITLSSAAVYGNPRILPIKENSETNPISPYGYDKEIAERICHMFSTIYEIDTYCLRLFSVYGRGIKKQLIWDVCNKFYYDDIVSLFGTGNETRDFIHVDDIVKIIELIIKSGKKGYNVFNCANGCQISVKQVAEQVKAALKSKKEIVFSNQNREGDPLNWEADIKNIKEMGYSQSVSFISGISDYVEWFIEEVK